MLFFLFFLIHEIFKVLLQLKYIFLPIPRHDISYIRTAVALFFNSKGNTYSKVYKIRPLKRIKWRQFSSDRDFIRRHDGCRQRGIDRFFLFPRCLLRSGSQGPGRVARAANIESRSSYVPFSSRFTVSTRREIYPFKWHVPTNSRSSREKA